MSAETFDVVVVGSGWNGLICAKTYLDFEPNAKLVIIDEQASIGGVWSKEKIYPSLFAQIKIGLFEYSCYPMRREGITDDGYISGATINTYLNDFARDFDLVRRTKLNTEVIKVDRLAADINSGWRLRLANGDETVVCRKLIYASGATSHPVVPYWPTSPKFSPPIIHSSEIGLHLDALSTIRKAVVVGAAKSAYDTVFLLLSKGIQVDWIIREDGTGPLAIMPPTILGLVNSMDVISTRAMAALGSSVMSINDPGYRFFQKTRLGRFVALNFWRTVTWIAERHAGYSRSPNAQKLRPLPHGNGIFWANAGLGCASVPDFWKVFHHGDCTVHRTEIASLDNGTNLTLLGGEKLQTDYVFLCTGFDKSYHQFDSALQAELGLIPDPAPEARKKWTQLDARAEQVVDDLLPVLAQSPVPPSKHENISSGKSETKLKPMHGPSLHYRRLVVPSLAAKGDRSVVFPGFIHSIYTPLVSEVQALWGVAFLIGLHQVPTEADMEVEVATWKAWCRKRYLAQGRKHAYAIFDFIPYIDNLLRDLGVKTKRRSNGMADLFLPAYPRLYEGIVDEFKSVYAHEHLLDGKNNVVE